MAALGTTDPETSVTVSLISQAATQRSAPEEYNEKIRFSHVALLSPRHDQNA
jgi:hypothetical protein